MPGKQIYINEELVNECMETMKHAEIEIYYGVEMWNITGHKNITVRGGNRLTSGEEAAR